MTVKEGINTYISQTKEKEWTNPYKFQLAPINPMLTSKYYEYLIQNSKSKNLLEAWDLLLGVQDLSTCIISLRKALDKKNGILQPEDIKRDNSMEIDE